MSKNVILNRAFIQKYHCLQTMGLQYGHKTRVYNYDKTKEYIRGYTYCRRRKNKHVFEKKKGFSRYNIPQCLTDGHIDCHGPGQWCLCVTLINQY